MFGLVVFPDKLYGIYPAKNITKLDEWKCLVKHKGAKYEAIIVKYHESKSFLENLKQERRQINRDSENCFEDFSFGTDYIEPRNTNSFLNSFSDDLFDEFNSSKDNEVQGTSYQELEECFVKPEDFRDDSVEDPNYTPESDKSDFDQEYDESCSNENTKTRPKYVLQDISNNRTDDSGMLENDLQTNVRSLSSVSNSTSHKHNNIDVADVSDSELNIDLSRKKGDKKENFCLYCHTKQQKIARHLEIKHKDECDVKSFMCLPKGHPDRRLLIGKIRKNGNFLYNTKQEFNDGKLIVSRRPNATKNKQISDYKPCANCKAFFSKTTLSTHYKLCIGAKNLLGKREVMFLSKQVHGKMHHKASDVVRRYLIPPLREDNVVKIIRHDELIIIFGNKMCEKYRNPRHYEMIRQKMRLMGRFLIQLMAINKDVSDFSTLFDPKFVDDVMNAINKTAKFNAVTSIYEAPTTAFNLGTLIKQSGNILITETIKNHDVTKKTNVKDFLKIFVQELNFNINKTVAESQLKMKRSKHVLLPSMDDITKLRDYLNQLRNKALQEIEFTFSIQNWTTMAEATLISIQVFNRRRPGEIERILIEDFENYQKLDGTTDKDFYTALSEENKEMAKKYVRFEIRGKLNRTVPVILDINMLKCVKTIINNRDSVGVLEANPYVFGTPGGIGTHFKACNLMRKFSEMCGASNPQRLRATHLRKHIATTCITLNLQDDEVTDLANFMGHDGKIHKNIYRQPVLARDLLGMSKLLEKAQGVPNESDDECSGNENFDDHDEEPQLSESVSHPATSTTTSVKERKTTQFGSVRRVRWTEQEKNVIFSVFKKCFDNKTLPSLKTIQKVILQHPELRDRTPPQIKTWIHNQQRQKGKRLSFN